VIAGASQAFEQYQRRDPRRVLRKRRTASRSTRFQDIEDVSADGTVAVTNPAARPTPTDTLMTTPVESAQTQESGAAAKEARQRLSATAVVSSSGWTTSTKASEPVRSRARRSECPGRRASGLRLR